MHNSQQHKHPETSQDTTRAAGKKGMHLADNRGLSNPVQRKPNNTGLPDNLKSGIENLSGHSMDDVKVHYNSSAPAQLSAHAYAQGTNIHIAPGQEKHLPHEAWHVVQQKQGRVKPTTQLKSNVNVNDDHSLEQEADVMGAKAYSIGRDTLQRSEAGENKKTLNVSSFQSGNLVQRFQYRSGTDYIASKGAEFVSQSRQKSTWQAGYKTTSTEKPNLKVATDNSMAIEDTKKQAKNFYSAQAVMNQSNTALESAGSPVRLMHTSGSITTDLSTVLHRTVWRFHDKQEPGATLGSHICNEVASKISGGLGPPAAPLVLKDQNPQSLSTEQVSDISYYSRTNTSISAALAFDETATPSTVAGGLDEKLPAKRTRILLKFKPLIDAGKVGEDTVKFLVSADAVTTATEDGIYALIQTEYERTQAIVTEENLQKLIHQRYGSLSPETLDTRSKALGVNQHAVPEVGEAVATFPTGGVDHTQRHPKFQEQLQEFIAEKQVTIEQALQQFEGVKVEGWTWHFASAVAKSLDNKDYVTLENYNRGSEQEEEIKRVYTWVEKHLTDFKRHLGTFGVTAEEQQSPEKVYGIMIPFLEKSDPLLHQILSQAQASFDELAKLDKGTLWYFAMYGPAKEQVLKGDKVEQQDQSFHQAMTETGDFANPLTLRFRGEKAIEISEQAKTAMNDLTAAQGLLIQANAAMSSNAPRESVQVHLNGAHASLLKSTIAYSKLPSTEKKTGYEYVKLINEFYKSVKKDFDEYQV